MPIIEYHKSLASTNDHLKKNIKKYKNFDLVWTHHQKKGRGRGHKKWHSAKGKSLTFSLVMEKGVKKDPQLKSIPLSLLTAISLCQVLVQLKGLASQKKSGLVKKKSTTPNIHIKWPNDILIDGHKVAGILIDEMPHHWIVGIGINVNHSSEEIQKLNLDIQNELKVEKPPTKNTQRLATSIFEVTKNPVDKEELLNKLHKQLIKNYQLYQSDGFSAFVKKWRKFSLCTCEEETVGFFENGERKKAVLHDLSKDGVLVLTSADKQMEVPWEDLTLL